MATRFAPSPIRFENFPRAIAFCSLCRQPAQHGVKVIPTTDRFDGDMLICIWCVVEAADATLGTMKVAG